MRRTSLQSHSPVLRKESLHCTFSNLEDVLTRYGAGARRSLHDGLDSYIQYLEPEPSPKYYSLSAPSTTQHSRSPSPTAKTRISSDKLQSSTEELEPEYMSTLTPRSRRHAPSAPVSPQHSRSPTLPAYRHFLFDISPAEQLENERNAEFAMECNPYNKLSKVYALSAPPSRICSPSVSPRSTSPRTPRQFFPRSCTHTSRFNHVLINENYKNEMKENETIKETLPAAKGISSSLPTSPQLSVDCDEIDSDTISARRRRSISCNKLTTITTLHKRQVMRNLSKMRKDLSSACKRLVYMSNSMGDSIELLFSNKSHPKDQQQQPQEDNDNVFNFETSKTAKPERVKRQKRRIKVIQKCRERRLSIEEVLTPASSPETYQEDQIFNFDIRNISSSLVLTFLKDRLFKAEMSLAKLPEGEISLCVNNFQILVISGHVKAKTDYVDETSRPTLYGKIDIPIYVDCSKIQFKYNDDDMILYIAAPIKC